jgi:hypothetical protein
VKKQTTQGQAARIVKIWEMEHFQEGVHATGCINSAKLQTLVLFEPHSKSFTDENVDGVGMDIDDDDDDNNYNNNGKVFSS